MQIEFRDLAEQRHRDPAASLLRATELLTLASDPLAEAMARWVIGLDLQELGRPEDAVDSYRRAAEISDQGDIPDVGVLARGGMAIAYLSLGDTSSAEGQIVRARSATTDTTRGVVEMLYGLFLQRTGRLDDALAIYRRAEPWLKDNANLSALALLHLNRGILHAYQGSLEWALRDLSEAEDISRQRQLPVLVAMATQNLGFALGRRGDIPSALGAFTRAEAAYAAVGRPARLVAVLQADRCEVVMLAGLVAEATTAAEAAVSALKSIGDVAYLTECRLLLARALLASGRYPEAAIEAELAASSFERSNRPAWAALANYVSVQAEILERENDDNPPPPVLLNRSRLIAVRLHDHGWPVEAVHVRTFVGRLALALGQPGVARSELSQAVAARHTGPADLRARAWHATALLRLAEGNVRGAKVALSHGMAVVDEYRATLGATELRAGAAGHGADLARLGIRLALQDRRAIDLLRWAERWRAGALRRPPIRPPDDQRMAEDLAALRLVYATLRQAALDPAQTNAARAERNNAAPDPIRALQSRAIALEEAVRHRTLEARDDSSETGRIDVARLRRALNERWLVEFVTVEGQVYALTVSAARVRLHKLAASARLADERRYLLFAVRRLFSGPNRAAAESALKACAAQLDEFLFRPLRLPPDVPIVVVPTGLLHGLPWATLPSLTGRTVTIAPSATVWLSQDRDARPDTELQGQRYAAALVAGPGLPGGDDEVRQLDALYRAGIDGGQNRGRARTFIGDGATASAVMDGLEHADLAHLAAHGTFRSDTPLFSSVLLADGPLTVYDLERLRNPPHIVVLASCDAAVSAVRMGDELLGTAAALIGIGVRSVIAPVMAVPDGATAAFMVALHRRLRAGDPPATALVAARAGQDHAIGEAFICIGCNDPATAESEGVIAIA